MPAHALEPGVHVDPGSPAAKEYAIPLSQAREEGAPTGSSGSDAARFGAGITPAATGRSSAGKHTAHAGTHASAGAGGTGPGGGGASGGGTSNSPQLPAAVLTGASAHSSNSSSLLVLIGGGVLILVLGGFGGTVLRHGRPPRSTP